MRVLIGAGLAMLFLATAASAQTALEPPAAAAVPPSQCPAEPADPLIADGATANNDAMAGSSEGYQAWVLGMQAVATCREAEFEQARATMQARAAEHNAVAEKLRTVSSAWSAQSTVFCARPRMTCEN